MKCDVPIRNKRRKITMAKKTRAERNFKFETLQLHVGQEQPDPVTDARAVPIRVIHVSYSKRVGYLQSVS